jgi:hypothetical protein
MSIKLAHDNNWGREEVLEVDILPLTEVRIAVSLYPLLAIKRRYVHTKEPFDPQSEYHYPIDCRGLNFFY